MLGATRRGARKAAARLVDAAIGNGPRGYKVGSARGARPRERETMTRIFNSPSKYIQGADALVELGSHVAPLGSRLLAIATPAGIERVGDKVRDGFSDVDAEVVFDEFGGECSDREIERLCDVARAQGCDAIAGIGGGKVLDTAKAVAHYLGAPVVV